MSSLEKSESNNYLNSTPKNFNELSSYLESVRTALTGDNYSMLKNEINSYISKSDGLKFKDAYENFQTPTIFENINRLIENQNRIRMNGVDLVPPPELKIHSNATPIFSPPLVSNSQSSNLPIRITKEVGINSNNLQKPDETASFVVEKSGHIVMKEDLKNFNEKYGTFFKSIANTLGLDELEMRSIISQESRFKEKASHHKGSSGYMQLTKAPLNDLLTRPHNFAGIFGKIQPNSISIEAPPELHKLIKIFQEGKDSYSQLNQEFINRLNAIRTNPYLNTVYGLGYAAMLKNETNERFRNEKTMTESVNSKVNTLSRGVFLSKVVRMVQEIIPEAKVEDVKTTLSKLSSNESRNIPRSGASINTNDILNNQKCFTLLRRYNGNSTVDFGAGVRLNDMYAATVFVISQLAKNNPELRKRIQ